MAKRPQTLLKELRPVLAYWQLQVRMELRWAKHSAENAEKIASQMRKYQKEIRKKKHEEMD